MLTQSPSIIFELIKGEMAYVRDLENIEHVRSFVSTTINLCSLTP